MGGSTGVVRAGVSKAECEAPCSKSSLHANLCRNWVSDWVRRSGPGPTDYRSLALAAPIGSQIAPLSVSHKSENKGMSFLKPHQYSYLIYFIQS